MTNFVFLLVSLLILAAESGYLYFLGGEAHFDTKARDWGCPATTMLTSAMLGCWSWQLVPVFLLLWAALSTYWKRGPNAKWYHWALHGLGCGLAWTPVAWSTGYWAGLLVYSGALSVAFSLWSERFEDVRIEAGGRGAFIVTFLPLLFSF